MNIVVFGASGKVGRLLVPKLLQQGHTVTVFVHQAHDFKASKQLKIIKSDVHNAAFVESAVRGQDAVISTLGSWHTPTKDILSAAMRSIIPTMQRSSQRRIITLTGSGARAPQDRTGLLSKLTHALFLGSAKDVIGDAETHLQLLNESGLDWTTIRAPVMRDGSKLTYRLAAKSPKLWQRITREAVAQALVEQLHDKTFAGQAPYIHQA